MNGAAIVNCIHRAKYIGYTGSVNLQNVFTCKVTVSLPLNEMWRDFSPS